MKNLEFIDELNNYLMKRDKKSFLERYSELEKTYSSLSTEYIELRLAKNTFEYLFVGDFENLISEITELESEIFDVASDEQKVKLLVNKGVALGRLQKSDEAISVYNQALLYCKETELTYLKVSILTNLGVIYFRDNNFINALKYFLSAYELNKNSTGQVKLTSLLVNVGLIYLQLDMFTKAKYFLELSLTTIPKSREYAKITIYNNLLATYSITGDFAKADEMISMIKNGDGNISKADLFAFHRSLALYHGKKKEYQEAINEYKTIINEFVNNKNEVTNYQVLIAKNYLEMKDYQHCQEYLEEIDKNLKSGEKDTIRTYNELLEVKISYYSYRQDYKSAFKYSQEFSKGQKEKFHSLELQIIDELTNPITKHENNISFDAYEEKITELEDTNKELSDHEKLLVESLNDLRNESKIREKFISIISHDIRGPIGNIVQLLELLDDFETQAEIDATIAEVITAMKQTYSLTNELVNWAKEVIDVQKSSLSYINFKEVVNEINLLYKLHLETKHILIENNLSEEKLVFAHLTSVRTCFRNIIQNAIKYSEPYSKIEINQKIDSKYITFSIRDYGKVMSEQELENLFDCKKISTLGTSQEIGIGIGLLLVKELIDKSKGKIRCESKAGEGTTFYLSFPLGIDKNLTYKESPEDVFLTI